MRCLGAVGGQCPHYLATCGGLSGVQHGALVLTPHTGSYNPPSSRHLSTVHYTAPRYLVLCVMLTTIM